MGRILSIKSVYFSKYCLIVLKGENEEDRELVTNLMMHASDLNGPVKPFEIASTWSIMLSKEFKC